MLKAEENAGREYSPVGVICVTFRWPRRLLFCGDGAGGEIMPTAGFAGGDEDAVGDAGFERFGLGTSDGGIHAVDVFAVGKVVDVIRTVGDQVPKWLRVFIVLPFFEGDHL